MTDAREPRNDEERILAIMALYGVDRGEAQFILAIEDGDLESDVVEVGTAPVEENH
jgi:hypothetical protein